MKKLNKAGIACLFTLSVLSACISRSERTLTGLETMLDSLEDQLAPDRRVELWNFSLSKTGKTINLEGEVASKATYDAVSSSVHELFPEVTILVKLLPEANPGRLVNALVNNSVSHLRRDPSSKSELVSQALLGTPVRILKEAEGKYLIQVPDGYLGWVNMNEVHPMEPDELEEYRAMQKMVYCSQYGFAYSEPDENSMPVADLVISCMLPVISEKGAFYQAIYPDGRLAWVKKEEVVPAVNVFHRQASKEEVVHIASAFHGIPYLWGGNSAKNLDCSGLVSNVYFMNGILMPRDADQQSRCGREISTAFNAAGLEKGDLLFFGRKATMEEKERVTHVAIYIGEGEFIHAAGYRDRVSINSMDSAQCNYIENYPEIFVRATRIIGEEPNGFQPIEGNSYYKEILK